MKVKESNRTDQKAGGEEENAKENIRERDRTRESGTKVDKV